MSDVTEKIIICVSGEDDIFDYSELGLSFDDTEETILTAIRPSIKEKFDVDIMSDEGSWLYKTRKTIESKNIHIIPNSTAGKK